MIKEFLNIQEHESLPELCARLGQFLGLNEPVPMRVLLRAIDDPLYASHLITCRNTPGFLEPLLNDSKNVGYALPSTVEIASDKTPSNLALIKKASRAFFNWGRAGFSTLDAEALKRREDACLGCKHREVPKRFLQKLVATRAVKGELGHRLGGSVCKLCGCNLSRKIKLPSEFCPDNHPSQAGLTRWEEPMQS
jgi:hypothetical protein